MKKKISELKKKIIYRANYRGTKELDILLSSFVNKFIDKLDEENLLELLKFLETDDEILYKINQRIIEPETYSRSKIFNLFINHKP